MKKGSEFPLHRFHAYPCKFPAAVVRNLLQEYGHVGDIVFDPFVGSGTVMLEASLLGFSSIGNDINPLSCLLSKTKSTPIGLPDLKKAEIFLNGLNKKFKKHGNAIKPFHYRDIEHWFQKNVIKELSFLKREIEKIKNGKISNLFLIVLSSIIVRVSNQDSDTRYAAINKKVKDLETIRFFTEKAEEILKIYKNYALLIPDKKFSSKVYQLDSRDLTKIEENFVDLIITSPPYANTYDYYLYHKHRKFWLGMDVKYAQNNEIGSRREFSSLKEDPKKWEDDVRRFLSEMKRVIKKNKNIFIIIGDSVINKKLIKMDVILKRIGDEVGLKFMGKTSVPLSKHSRMFNPRFSSSFQKKEHLIHLKK